MGYLAVLLQVIGLYMVGRKWAAGWIFGIVAELLWIARASEKDMPDLMIISVIYIGLASWNFFKWRRA
jgi:hypothetical protein